MRQWLKYGMWMVGLLLVTNVNAQVIQASQVPQAVITSFRLMFADSYVYEWEWERKQKLYEAEFMFKGSKYEAFFQADGRWSRTEKELEMRDLPQPVVDAFYRSPYAKWKIDDIKEITFSSQRMIYNIEVEKGRKEVELFYTKEGQETTLTP